jgi:hypothetical protein
VVLFDGAKRRIEQVGLEYAFEGAGEAGRRSAETMRARKLTRAAAIKEGLLEEFEARYVSAYDGTAVLEYRESRGKPDGTLIGEMGHGNHAWHFDPRCFGQVMLSYATTLESGFATDGAESVTLIGKEIVEGGAAWHVEVKWPSYTADYWISVANPEWLLKKAVMGDVVVSRFDPKRPRDPLPIETVETARDGAVIRYRRLTSQYNIPVDPEFCTLASLGMARGTEVTDVRVHRRIGYWDGKGLSQDLPKKGEVAEEEGGLTLRDRMSFLKHEPESERGFEAATWIFSNTPDGEEVAKAGKALIDHHLANTNLFAIAERLEELRPRCQKDLLRGILEKNPVAEIRCRACFSLAITFRDEADFGLKKKETAEARGYFQRVIAEFSKAGLEAVDKVFKSQKAIKEIDTLWVGKAAPDFAAKTVTGEMFKLPNFSGRVVVLFFRTWGGNDLEWHQKLNVKFAPRGVQFVDVVCNKEIKYPVEWPTILDGDRGPIADLFMVRSWTSTFILGKDGKIRARDLGWDLEKGIEAALLE